jgi:hypothetical protein
MKINIIRTNIISFTGKTKNIQFNYYVGDILVVRTGCVKDIGVVLKSKLYFYLHSD